MRLLFVKETLAWPRSSGHDVHCFHMMHALGELGHQVALATVRLPSPEATQGLRLEQCVGLAEKGNSLPDAAPVEPNLTRSAGAFPLLLGHRSGTDPQRGPAGTLLSSRRGGRGRAERAAVPRRGGRPGPCLVCRR